MNFYLLCCLSALLFNTTLFSEPKSPKVVIIGAGIAGITAAYRLHQNHIDVEVYEARNRVGGRIFSATLQGNAIEFGGQNLYDGGESPHLFQLINEFSLEWEEAKLTMNHQYFDGEKYVSFYPLLLQKNYQPEVLKKDLELLAVTSNTLKEVMDPILKRDDPLRKTIEVRIAAYEGASVDKLSTYYVKTLYHMLLGGTASVHQGEENYFHFSTIVGGNSKLPQKIADQLGDRIHLKKILIKICKKDTGYLLEFSDGSSVQADLVILAIPCSVYNTIDFEEGIIPLEKLAAIKNVRYGTNAKILIPFEKTPQNRIGFVNDQIVSFFNPNLRVLTLYFTSEYSRFTKETISSSYHNQRPMFEKKFEKFPDFKFPEYARDESSISYDGPVGFSWPNDPFAKGSYSYIAPGQESVLTETEEREDEIVKRLFAPIDHLYFAGEHTSCLMDVPGTMEAACESGEKAWKSDPPKGIG